MSKINRMIRSKKDNQTILEICRLCGACSGYKMPIIQNDVDLDDTAVELKQKIRECVQIEVHHNDKMPPLICERCVDKVNDFYEFLEMCRETNKHTRLRLGLPPQSMPGGDPDSGDCIPGLTEAVYVNDDTDGENRNPIQEHKSNVKIKKNPQVKLRFSKSEVIPPRTLGNSRGNFMDDLSLSKSQTEDTLSSPRMKRKWEVDLVKLEAPAKKVNLTSPKRLLTKLGLSMEHPALVFSWHPAVAHGRRLVIRDIGEPDGQILENLLHSKRRRVWQTSKPTAPAPPTRAGSDDSDGNPSCSASSREIDVEVAPPTSPALAPASPLPSLPSPVTDVEDAPQAFSPASPLPSLPSPVAFAEIVTSSAPASPINQPSHHHPRQSLRDGDAAKLLNLGSDADSDESDDENVMRFPLIPRVHRATMKIPLDKDEFTTGDDHAHDVGDTSSASAPSDAAADSWMCNPDLKATDQPWGLFNFDWKEFPNSPLPPDSRRETFSQSNVGPTTPHADPYDIFCAIWDRQIMEHIARETNRYAQQVTSQMLHDRKLHPRSRINQWRDTSADELYTYFALVIGMGLVVKSRLEEYWSATSDLLNTPGFSAYMPISRFLLLNKCLHFVNNEDMYALDLDGSEARLFKIKPLLTHLNEKFQNLLIPAQNIALDESLLMWTDWQDICHPTPKKAANRSIKSYELCESRTGYLWRFEVHANKNSAPKPPKPENPLDQVVPAVVLRLTQGLEHKGYTLWMDNFNNSPCLARRLKSLGYDCVGTLRTDSQYVPEALHSLTKRRMGQGEIAGLTSGDVDVLVCSDANRVAMSSTYHGNAVHTLRGSNKPILILAYNMMMGGLDKKDQTLAMYPIERTRTKVWYKKLFRRLLNVSILNSFIIHRHNSSSSALSHRNFRVSLLKSLLSKHGTPLQLPFAIKQNVRIDVSHRLGEYPVAGRQRMRRRCVVCKRLVHTFCVGCSKTTCLDPCFLTIHS